ncbi:MAG TPA: SPOR domain-containing protein [Rhodocyclaceae bacterium]|nr:SPOR domain-containing protein [Rhodocyclaceae bacterium]
MSRDMKPRKSAPAKKSGGGTLIGMFIGLVLGVGIAAGVVWYMNRAPVPFVTKSATAAKPDQAAAPAAAAAGKANQPAQPVQSGQPAQPMALPGKPGDPVPEKRFQFYDILPGKSDAVPGGGKPVPEAKKDDKKEEPKKDDAKKEEPKQPLFLQAGSFSKPTDADNLKASLALMGVEASVQQVMVQDKTFYRVRLGPYSKPEEVNKVRSELAKAGIDASLVKKE